MSDSDSSGQYPSGQGWGNPQYPPGAGGWGQIPSPSAPITPPGVAPGASMAAYMDTPQRTNRPGLVLLISGLIYAALNLGLRFLPYTYGKAEFNNDGLMGALVTGSVESSFNGYGWGRAKQDFQLLGIDSQYLGESGKIFEDSLSPGEMVEPAFLILAIVSLLAAIIGGIVAWRLSTLAGAIVLALVAALDIGFFAYCLTQILNPDLQELADLGLQTGFTMEVSLTAVANILFLLAVLLAAIASYGIGASRQNSR